MLCLKTLTRCITFIVAAGTADFLGSNFYSASLVSDDPQPAAHPPNYYNDQSTKGSTDPTWIG